jgi:hypothetical protein
MSATYEEQPRLSIVDSRVAELQEQLTIAKGNCAAWEVVAHNAARVIEVQRMALRRLRTPSPN